MRKTVVEIIINTIKSKNNMETQYISGVIYKYTSPSNKSYIGQMNGENILVIH